MSRPLVIVAVLLAAAAARADETNAITVTPEGGSVSVTILGITPDGPITADGDRLEIALEGSPAPSALDVKDPTLRRVEIVDGKISLQLSHGSHTTKQIAAGAKVASSTSGVTIAFPRKGMPAVTSIAPPPVAEAAPTPARAVEPPAPAAATTVPPPAASAPPPVTATPATMPGIPSSTTSPVGFALAGVLTAAAIGAYLFARRKKGEVGRSALKVLATTPMGTRSRLVLVAAGERELLLAVDQKGVTLIEKWRSEGGQDDEDDLGAPEPKFASPLKPASPAVSGLLRLRNGKERA